MAWAVLRRQFQGTAFDHGIAVDLARGPHGVLAVWGYHAAHGIPALAVGATWDELRWGDGNARYYLLQCYGSFAAYDEERDRKPYIGDEVARLRWTRAQRRALFDGMAGAHDGNGRPPRTLLLLTEDQRALADGTVFTRARPRPWWAVKRPAADDDDGVARDLRTVLEPGPLLHYVATERPLRVRARVRRRLAQLRGVADLEARALGDLDLGAV